MQFCKPRTGQACFFYQGESSQARLDEFLKTCGGTASKLEGVKAVFVTVVKGEPRHIYAMPGSWVRCLGPAQFTAMSGQKFQQQYELV